MKAILSVLNTFSGPIGGLVEKGILAGVMYLFGLGKIQGDAVGIAASIYAALSGVFTALVNTQTGKAVSIVETQGNGITVVPKLDAYNAGVATVTEPQPQSSMSK